MKKLIAAGFNPARQKVLTFEKLNSGKVNRAAALKEFPSGKGINFCRAAGCYGGAEAVLIQFCGGVNGSFIDGELQKEGMSFYSIRTKEETRCCDTCIDLSTGNVTELIEPSYPAAPEEVEAYVSCFKEQLKTASAAAFCGTLPTGTDKTLYARLAKLTAEAGLPLLVDAWRDVDDIFASGAEIWLKINREELAALTGKEDISCAFAYLSSCWGIRKAAVTDGPDTAYAYDGKEIMAYTLPRLDHVVNPIGCGDTASAVLSSELVCGSDIFTAFQKALGAASANCLSDFCGSFRKEDSEFLSSGTVFKPVSS
ncbi:MAG: hypothetical protein IKC65_06600 [Lentisphaeria bacterium]|nr:hypothetical protein [Lentisphaeria bacterium]